MRRCLVNPYTEIYAPQKSSFIKLVSKVNKVNMRGIFEQMLLTRLVFRLATND
jgi:hypothetical protein